MDLSNVSGEPVSKNAERFNFFLRGELEEPAIGDDTSMMRQSPSSSRNDCN